MAIEKISFTVNHIYLLAIVAAVTLFSSFGCRTEIDPLYVELSQTAPTNTMRADELAPTDRFEIRVAGEPEISGAFTVPSSGMIDFPWIGSVEVSGHTCSHVGEEVRHRLSEGYLLEPSVTCQILEINSRRIDVIGEVNHPGSYPYEENMTILRAVARAEGFSDDAAPNETNVLRIIDSTETRIRVPIDEIIAGLQPNFILLPGDTVVVPRFVLVP